MTLENFDALHFQYLVAEYDRVVATQISSLHFSPSLITLTSTTRVEELYVTNDTAIKKYLFEILLVSAVSIHL